MSQRRAQIGKLITVPLSLSTLLLPVPLPADQQVLLALVVAAMCLWMTEALPIPATAMLIGPALVVTGITDAQTAFAPYADSLLFLFYGAFFIAAAMQRHGLDRRIAEGILSLPWLQGRGSRARLALMLAGLLLSMWISNTATTAILVPILLGTQKVPGHGRSTESVASPEVNDSRGPIGGLLAIAYVCSVGGLGTLVGTPPNLIAVRMLREVDVQLDFLSFSMIGLPTALALAVAIYFYLQWRFPAPERSLPIAPATAPRPSGATPAHPGRTPLSRGEVITACSLGLAVAGFVLPPLLAALEVPGGEALRDALRPPAVAMLAATPLFVLHDENAELVLPWSAARRVDWGLIMLFGGGITLGSQMFSTGLAESLGRGFISVTGVNDLWALTGLCIFFTLFMTEVCSNTASANMLLPLVLGVTAELGLPPTPPALGVCLAASCAFMMPIATGPNAIAYGTGLIPIGTMNRAGLALNLIAGVLIFALLRMLCPLYGWSE